MDSELSEGSHDSQVEAADGEGAAGYLEEEACGTHWSRAQFCA